MAYRRLALAATEPIRSGLEGAVEFGTAQQARMNGVRVAGKTGSVRASDGAMIAWFAGFAPSRAPKAVVTVMLQGRSGGGDAAPLGGRILGAHLAGRL
jgi:cell division protein FtsI/penicillin-binding protein 2